MVTFTLNGKTVVARSGQTILQAAQAQGIDIPRLCYMEGMRADGNCRTCMVEIKGERVLAPSCCRYPNDGHGGHHQQRARHHQSEDVD
jgi:formate dehydrogenase major subunit